MEFDHSSVLLQLPFRLICAGASGVGKSWFVKDFIEHVGEIVNGEIDTIIYCYSEDQPLYRELAESVPSIIWIEGFDETIDQYLQDMNKKKLLVIDDQMCEGATSPYLLSLFTKRSHHSNTSIIFITQNIFFQGKYCRTISLNSTCFCVFKNPRDQRQISSLASQICPWKISYEKYIMMPLSYLFLIFL